MKCNIETTNEQNKIFEMRVFTLREVMVYMGLSTLQPRAIFLFSYRKSQTKFISCKGRFIAGKLTAMRQKMKISGGKGNKN